MVETIRESIISVQQLDNNFATTGDSFHQRRSTLIANNEFNRIPLDDGPKTILHVVPESAFEEGPTIEFGDLAEEEDTIPTFWRRRPSITAIESGLVTSGGGDLERDEPVTSYTLVVQNGIIEVVSQLPFDTHTRNDVDYLGTSLFETGTSAMVSDAITYLDDHDAEFPLRVNLSIVSAEDYVLLYEGGDFGYNSVDLSHRVEPFGITVESPSANAREVLDPLFRNFWRMLGHNESPYYDSSQEEWADDARERFDEFMRD